MGDFCVAGFHSRLPIYNGDKVVAIICRKNDTPLGNVPHYLSGPLIPFAMPLIGEMNDYGYLDYIEDNETTAAIENISGKLVIEIIEDICRISQFDKPEDYPEFFMKFDKCVKYNKQTGIPYHVIYEHYDIYESMTFDWPAVKNFCNKMDAKLHWMNFYETADEICNPFHMSMFNPFIWWFEHNLTRPFDGLDEMLTIPKDSNGCLSPSTAIYNVASQSIFFMGLYDKEQLNFKTSAEEIAKFCSFINTLEQTYGHFYYSVGAGQEWHHDTGYFKTLSHIQKAYNNTLKRLKEHHKR